MKFSCHKISEALKESLTDMRIIDKTTGKPTQDYFELDIKKGPILGLAQKAYDLEGIFHVGCTLDRRPPSFHYGISIGDIETVEGETSLSYNREMELATFLKYDSFRKESPIAPWGIRDLEKVGNAFNNEENYRESFGLGWEGWSGDYSQSIFKPEEQDKVNFSGAGIGVEFKNKICTEFNGIRHIYQQPIKGYKMPFPKLAKNTRLERVVKTYQELQKANNASSLASRNLNTDGIKLEDLMIGLLQMAEKILPAKMSTEKLEPEIIKVCSEFSLV
jgi:hypothetical protein